MEQSCAIVGSGIAGIASAIRLAAKGYKVSVFEKGNTAGGKISSLKMKDFRFDTGPSLLTMPDLINELFELAGEKPEKHFRTVPLSLSCKYFWEDGTVINAWQDASRLADEIEDKTGVRGTSVRKFLDHCRRLYEYSGESFLFHSLHKPGNYFTPAFRKTLLNAFRLDAFATMNTRNSRWFGHPKVVQLFNRYATYNGSNPYSTPATLNMIAHLEHNVGACFPENGMYSIVESLTKLAESMGVQFFFDTPVHHILTSGRKAWGLKIGEEDKPFDLVVSNADIVATYRDLLPGIPIPRKQLSLQRSSSALIYYWGINQSFPGMELHNILFSNNYKEEFEHLFGTGTISEDPSVYIFISSKVVESDAPPGCENWYVMINAPENKGQEWEAMIRQARAQIIRKINHVLKTDISRHIVTEAVADPRSIEAGTGSYRGSLYGLSSNSMMAAFNRHPNFRRRVRNLYFAGGSVHPGGGIPLCLASAKIVAEG